MSAPSPVLSRADLEAIGPVDAFECRAPCFAATDERQRRVFNPVTATTLVGNDE